MKLALKRFGGVMRIARPTVTVDTTVLPATEREHLQELVAAARLDSVAKLTDAHPDETSYELEVTHDDGSASLVQFTHATASPELRTLAAEISKRRQ